MNFVLTDTVFKNEDIEKNIVGAGILPVAYHDGEYFVLLGKERFITHWKGSLKWSGFEGGRKSDESIERTAAREYMEESLGVVPIGNADTISSVENLLKRGEYICKLVLCIANNNVTQPKYHATYLVQVEYDSAYPAKFQSVRTELFDLQYKITNVNKYRDELISKGLLVDSSTYQIESITCYSENIRIQYSDLHGNLHCNIEELRHFRLYTLWFQAKNTVTAMFRNLSPQAVAGVRSKAHDIRVNEDYIEKQCIRWWSINDLIHVLENNGVLHNEFFRAYFLPVLKRCLQEILQFPRNTVASPPSLVPAANARCGAS